jgi:hypothetical protein
MSGSNGMSTATTGNTQMPTSAFPNSAFGATTGTGAQGLGMGQNTMGALGGQQQGLGAGAAGQQQGMVGQRSTRLAGNAQAGQTTPGQMNQMNNRQGQNRNNARRTGQTANQNQAGAGAGNQQQRSVRPQMVVNFDYPAHTPDNTETALTTRFSKLANKVQFQAVEIEVNGTRVILRGEVASQQDIKLASILARLEPGVRTVQNELTVAPDPEPAVE